MSFFISHFFLLFWSRYAGLSIVQAVDCISYQVTFQYFNLLIVNENPILSAHVLYRSFEEDLFEQEKN